MTYEARRVFPAITLGGCRVVVGEAPPSDGVWRRGDVVVNRAPSTGSPTHWVCLVAGQPGTWGAGGADAYDPAQWTDLQVPDTALRPGGTSPTLTTFKGNTRLYAYSAGESVEFSTQLPHSWKEGTEIRPHLHLAFPDANAGKYKWSMEYTLAEPTGVFGDTVTISTDTLDAPGVAFKHALASFPAIDMTGKTLSTVITGRIVRDTVASAYAADIFLASFDFHYQMDTPGSSTELLK